MFSPLKLASDYAHRVRQSRRIDQGDLPRVGELLLRTKAYRWNSDFFDRSPGVSPARGQAVVDAVFYEQKARRELKRAIDRLGGVGASLFWDTYLRRSVNSVLGFSQEHLELLKLAHSALPDRGTIVDWNCGTGNTAAALLLAAPERTLIAADSNPRAVMAAKRLFRYFFPQNADYSTKVTSPTDPECPIRQVRGAVLENALFLIEGDAAKLEFLKSVAAHLKQDAILVLVEPKPSLQKQSVLRLWIQRLVESAVRHYSPANEFDIALFTEVQRRLFTSAPGTISSTKELVALCGEAGFEVNLVRDVLHGHYSALVLRRLAPEPPKPKSEPIIRYHDEPYPQ